MNCIFETAIIKKISIKKICFITLEQINNKKIILDIYLHVFKGISIIILPIKDSDDFLIYFFFENCLIF